MFSKDPLKFHCVEISYVACAYFLAQRRYKSLEIPYESCKSCTVRTLSSVLNSLGGRMPSGLNVRSVDRALVLSFTHVRFSLAIFWVK
jgi:hypothetical protein